MEENSNTQLESNRTEWSPGGNVESNRTEWSPGGNGGVLHGDNDIEKGANAATDKIAEVVTQAKDYLGEKVSTVGGKIKDFATDDLSGMAEKAKDYARQNPGQAMLVAAAAGVLLGLIVRGRR